CYSANKNADLVFFIHTTPAVYHGTRVYTNNSTSAAAATDGNGNSAGAAASSSSTTAIPYSVDYSVFLLDIERQQPDGSFRILRTRDQQDLNTPLYGPEYGKRKHKNCSVDDARVRQLTRRNFG